MLNSVAVQSLSCVWLFVTSWTSAHQFPCPSPFPRVGSDSCSLNQWFYPNISSSVIPCSFCPQSCPVSGSFRISLLFESGGQSIGASASASVQFSRSVVSDSLWPHGLQHTRLPCPSPTPRVYSNTCPLSKWYHPTISSSVIPFSYHPHSFPEPGSFPMSHFFPSGG